MKFETYRHTDAKTGCCHARESLYYFLYYYILAALLFTGSLHSGWLWGFLKQPPKDLCLLQVSTRGSFTS